MHHLTKQLRDFGVTQMTNHFCE